MCDNNKERYNLKNTGLIYHLVIIGALLLIIPTIAVFHFVNKDNYYIFSEKRIAEMEELFQTDFSSVKLEKYSVGAYRGALYFSGVEDYEEFIEGCVSGKAEFLFKDNNAYDLKNNTQSKISSVEDEIMRQNRFEAMYYITCSNNTDFRISFYKENNGTYSAVASYSTWGVCY